MSAQHTAGPWYWHTDSEGRVSLRTPDRGNLVVMDCARKGMRGGAPRFAMWPGIVEGTPRGRLGGILQDGAPDVLAWHPDAILIVAAPELLAELERSIAHEFNPFEPDNQSARYQRMQALYAKATGTAGGAA